jgi:O-acetyl-ADP-ribose deacetylase (regulator of RNase III)
MTQDERLEYLINTLRRDNPSFTQVPVPSDTDGRKKLLRSLMNVWTPHGLSETFMQQQNEYLRLEAIAKGIVDVDSLPAVDGTDGKLVLWQGDITRLKADAIVNAANKELLGCFYPLHGCIDNAIHSAAGLGLRMECAQIMGMQHCDEPTGKAKITGGYCLPAKHVIHTVGPIIRFRVHQSDCDDLASCYRSCLELASQNGLESIVFCCISTGEFRFPNEKAAQIAVETVNEFLRSPSSIRRVVFNVFKDKDLKIYSKLLNC